MDAVEPLERLPGGGLAHRDVGVARRALRPHRRGRHAHREAGAHERSEEADLLLLEREDGVVARDHRGRRGEGVLLPEESVGGRHRRLRHEQPVVHVAEVEETRHRPGVGPRRPHDHVVVVRVAVDDPPPEAGEGGHDLRLVAGERPLDERPAPGVGHVGESTLDPGGTGEVPREVAVGGRVLEVSQGPVHLAEDAPQVGEQLRWARPGLGQRRAREPRQHEDEAGRAVRPRGQGQGLAGGRGDDAGQGEVRGPILDVPQGRALQLDQPPIAPGVHGLQHEEPPVRHVQSEVVVELPRERPRCGLEAIAGPRQGDRVPLGQGVVGAAARVHGGDCATIAEPSRH